MLLWALLAFGGIPSARADTVTVRQFQMGMLVEITVASDRPDAAREACRTAFARLLELNRVFSDYDPESELSALCRRAGQGPVPVSSELYAVLARAQTLARESGGAFDVTAGPVIRLWREARRTGVPPAADALAAARARGGWTNLVLRADGPSAELRVPGMKLDLGAIAKGMMLDATRDHLRERGFASVRIEAGGELLLGDAPPGRAGWPVEAPLDPPGKLELANAALSVSGDASQHLDANGVRHSHVVDARTGLALTNRVTCVVRDSESGWSDPLATLGTLLPEPEWRSLLHRLRPEARGWVGRAKE